MKKKMEIVKTCGCGKEFSLEDVAIRVKKKIMPMYDKNGNLKLYLFNCDCGSTLAIKFEIIDVDNNNLAPLKDKQ